MALDVTIGGAVSDSYSTLEDWEAYVGDFLDQDISAHAHDASHESNLRRAAAYLDRSYNWIGSRVTATQSLQWPRKIYDYIDGFPVSTTEIPTAIIKAQSEIAWLIHEGVDVMETISGGAIKGKKVKAGPVETATEYSGSHEGDYFTAIEGMIAPYITGKIGAGGLKSVSLVRG